MYFQHGIRKLKRNKITHLSSIAKSLPSPDSQAQCLLAQYEPPHASSLKNDSAGHEGTKHHHLISEERATEMVKFQVPSFLTFGWHFHFCSFVAF